MQEQNCAENVPVDDSEHVWVYRELQHQHDKGNERSSKSACPKSVNTPKINLWISCISMISNCFKKKTVMWNQRKGAELALWVGCQNSVSIWWCENLLFQRPKSSEDKPQIKAQNNPWCGLTGDTTIWWNFAVFRHLSAGGWSSQLNAAWEHPVNQLWQVSAKGGRPWLNGRCDLADAC